MVGAMKDKGELPLSATQKIEKKLRLMAGLFDMAYEVKKRQLKEKFPALSNQEINHKAYALIEKGCK